MSRGDKDKYTDKQKREASHIEESYEKKGVSKKESEKRAWATVNKVHGGGAKGGSGTAKVKNPSPLIKGGKKDGKAQAKRPATARSASAKKAAETRKEKKEEKSWFARLFS